MIKVNLLPQRKARRSISAGEASASKQFALGVGVLVAAAAGVFFIVDMPKRSKMHDLQAANEQLQQQINEKNSKLQGYEELRKAKEQAEARALAIEHLINSKVIPAHLLHELGQILTHKGPTMTEAMTKAAGTGPESNPNKRFQADWDPQHVWITSFVDTNGVFKLDGGAQSESDVTQLAKRIAASIYFRDVSPAGGDRIADRVTGIEYYHYVITGRVAY